MGRRPLRGERAKPSPRETLGFRESLVVRPGDAKSERGEGCRESMPRSWEEGAPKRSKRPRRARAPTRANPSGAKRGTAFTMGASRWGADGRRKESSGKARGRRGSWETEDRSSWRRKALKGEAQERWELKEAPEGWGELTPSRG
jgi:hypothetical protein